MLNSIAEHYKYFNGGRQKIIGLDENGFFGSRSFNSYRQMWYVMFYFLLLFFFFLISNVPISCCIQMNVYMNCYALMYMYMYNVMSCIVQMPYIAEDNIFVR